VFEHNASCASNVIILSLAVRQPGPVFFHGMTGIFIAALIAFG
jgi:hypothetical protein